MKDRWLTLLLALVAFAAFYVLLGPKAVAPQERPTRPISTEAGPNGYLALDRWLAAQGVRTQSLRERFGHLPALTDANSPTGNLLISTTPHLYPLRNSETAALQDWIYAGNTLLVVAGLSDTPDWSAGGAGNFMEHMRAMTGLSFTQAGQGDAPDSGATSDEDSAANAEATSPKEKPLTARDAITAFGRLAQPQRFELSPNGPHPLLEGVSSVLAISEYGTGKWRATPEPGELLFELARDPQTGVPVLWLLPHGEGQIIVSAYGSIFTNKLLGQQDNARLLANIVEWSRDGAGQVIIDDAHQGLVAYYDPEAFFGDTRLHRSLWWLLGLWLVFVLGSQRLRTATSRWNPLDITAFVRATGGFMARVLRPASAAQRLFANFFDDLRRQRGLPVNGAPLWDWLGTQAAVAESDLARLREWHDKALRGRRLDLTKLQNLLIQVRRCLNR